VKVAGQDQDGSTRELPGSNKEGKPKSKRASVKAAGQDQHGSTRELEGKPKSKRVSTTKRSSEIAPIEWTDNPKESDICLGVEKHPGTVECNQIIDSVAKEFANAEFSPEVYRAIKKQLPGRSFYLREDKDGSPSWRTATKPELVRHFKVAFNEKNMRGSTSNLPRRSVRAQ
jgi:hypothetical protein